MSTLAEKIIENKKILSNVERKIENLKKQREDLIIKIENQEHQLRNLQRKKAQTVEKAE